MKIILFTDCLGAGGAQRQLVGLAIMLKKKGYNVKVSTYYDIDFYKSQLDDACVPNDLIPGADNTWKRIMAVRSYFKKERPNWVIAYQETPSLVACAARVLGCKYKLIVSERNTTQFIGMNERVRFFLYHWADAIVPNSYAQEKWLRDHHSWMAYKLKTITNFVDLEKFSFVERTRRSIPEVMVVATIRDSKNTLGLIQAVKLAKERGLKFHISWYGKSDEFATYFDECQKMIIQLGITDCISLMPKTKEIHNKYKETDYFCLPSFYEGTPNVICEAISTGLPVACSNICDNYIYVQQNKNGFLFDPNSTDSMAEALERIVLQDSIDYDSYCKHSRSVAEQLLDKEMFLDKYLTIIER